MSHRCQRLKQVNCVTNRQHHIPPLMAVNSWQIGRKGEKSSSALSGD